MADAVRLLARQVFRTAMSRLPSATAAKMHYFLHHRRWPNLRQPLRFTEKVVRRKLVSRDHRMVDLVDKVAVKPIVAKAIGTEPIIPTLWSGKTLPPRAERNWPVPFVVKANHGSGTNLFVWKVDDHVWNKVERAATEWLQGSHGDWSGEWVYGEIDPLILIEPLIGSEGVLPWDYKLFVFGGKVAFIEVDTDRESAHKRTLFSPAWEKLPIAFGYPVDQRAIPAPVTLARMIADAETLGRDFGFVRVDFYEVEGRHFFGEMTFYPDSGKAAFDPDHHDHEYGALWTDE